MCIVLFILFLNLLINVLAINLNTPNSCKTLHDYPFSPIAADCYVNMDVLSTTPDIIERRGYNSLSYELKTDDGYFLQLYRILPKNIENFNTDRQPIFFQHGFATNSETWLGTRSLAILLADKGYDVWLGNLRGTSYSRGHTNLTDAEYNYWEFSLDTLVSDIKLFLRKIALETDKGGSIIYIGHSLGTTLLFMYVTNNYEEAHSLIKGAIALSPITYFDFTWNTGPMLRIMPILGKYLRLFHINVFFKNTHFREYLVLFCRWVPGPCRLFINIAFGTTHQFPAEDLLLLYSKFPESISLKVAEHYSQLYTSGKFRKYDYGVMKNKNIYKQETPPEYDLRQFKLPVYLLYGKKDSFIRTKAVQKLYSELGSIHKYVHSFPINNTDPRYDFNHCDFHESAYLEKWFFPYMLQYLNNINGLT